MEKFNYEVEAGVLKLGLDTDKDEQKSLIVELDLNEAVQEAFQKGEKVAGAKSVDVGFEGTMLTIKVDSDKDGEQIALIKVNLLEVAGETGLLK